MLLSMAASAVVVCCSRKAAIRPGELKSPEKTSFQVKGQPDSLYDIRADVVMMSDVENTAEKAPNWRSRGYYPAAFTCLSRKGDYINGLWDGKKHPDEAQLTQFGDTVYSGTPYYKNIVVVPTDNYIAQMKEHVIKTAIDGGAEAIYLEEPEFFARGGYSDAFKREWEKYYGFPWRPQHESAENMFYSNRLKAHLYAMAYEELYTYAKEYGRSLGKDIKCYAGIHSIINITQWHCIIPQVELLRMSCIDGIVAQVWTGTSREPNYYQGVAKERTFETAMLEYSCMGAMVRPYGKRAYFCTDPVEDNIKTWEDYKFNFQSGYVAELLYPGNNYYEVMPWPDRIYKKPYGIDAKGDTTVISKDYATQLQVMVDALNRMPVTENRVSGSTGIAVMLSSTMVYQPMVRPLSRKGFLELLKTSTELYNVPKNLTDVNLVSASEFISFDRTTEPLSELNDPKASNYFGLAMPLLKRGIPVGSVYLENLDRPGVWDGVDVLLLSYSGMKPLDPAMNRHISDWVKEGGRLIYFGRDTDPFQRIGEWWNRDGNSFPAPSAHLFSLMGIDGDSSGGTYAYGKGSVTIVRKDPKELALDAHGDEELMSVVKPVYEASGKKLEYKNSFYLERGPYDIMAVMEESVDNSPLMKEGLFIDLFDPDLPVIREKRVVPGGQAMLYDLGRAGKCRRPEILAVAGRAYDEKNSRGTFSFLVKGPYGTTDVMRIRFPKEPWSVQASVEGKPVDCLSRWDGESGTLRLEFTNTHRGVDISIDY